MCHVSLHNLIITICFIVHKIERQWWQQWNHYCVCLGVCVCAATHRGLWIFVRNRSWDYFCNSFFHMAMIMNFLKLIAINGCGIIIITRRVRVNVRQLTDIRLPLSPLSIASLHYYFNTIYTIYTCIYCIMYCINTFLSVVKKGSIFILYMNWWQ